MINSTVTTNWYKKVFTTLRLHEHYADSLSSPYQSHNYSLPHIRDTFHMDATFQGLSLTHSTHNSIVVRCSITTLLVVHMLLLAGTSYMLLWTSLATMAGCQLTISDKKVCMFSMFIGLLCILVSMLVIPDLQKLLTVVKTNYDCC